MDKKTIKEKFRQLTVWKRGGERAPHKPLLILYALGRLLRNKERLIPYQDIDEHLRKLLQDFGPERASHHPEFPFWRLQTDQLWVVTNAENIRLRKSGDAKKKDLIEQEISGGFPEDIFQELQKDPQLFREIVEELLTANFPSSIHEDILQSIGIDLSVSEEERKRDPEFREKILRAYEYRCAVCAFDVRLGNLPIALEAAHIKWKQAGGPDVEVNGIALCVLHHKLFDLGAFTLSEQLKIMVSDRANGHAGFEEWLIRFHGKELRLPQRTAYFPKEDFRTWHVKEVFKGVFREL